MSLAKRLSLVQVDVFTATPLQGNALAVVLDGRGLGDTEMQALARETNLSETTFVLPRDSHIEDERGIRVRIFTVAEELPFAGHPTLGTAFVLRGATRRNEIKLDLNVGQVPVRFEEGNGGPAFGEMSQKEPNFGKRHEPEVVAKILNLSIADLDTDLPIDTVSTGLPFTIVPLRSLSVIRSLRIDHARATAYLAEEGKFFYFVTRDTVDPSARLHARMLLYNGEDPATGSAAGCATAWMVAHGVAQPDERVLIEQGLEMNRPSQIFVRASRNDNRVVNVRVGGHAVEVMRAEVFF
jgi:trans-2,3-dihydro-3-hydroxyanthranilate isomerase